MLVVVFHSFFVLHFAVVLHSFPGYFAMPAALHPVFSGPWRPPPALSSTLVTFDCICFFIYRELYGFEWAFFTNRRFFTLRSFPEIFYSSCVYQGLPGSRQFFLEVCRASCWSSRHRLSPSVCLIHSNPQSPYSEEFVFKFLQILSWITCGKGLVYLPPTRFELFLLVQSHM